MAYDLLNEKHAGDFSEYVDFCYSHQYDGEEEYAEYHHILPRSTFPEMRDDPQFIVRLRYLKYRNMPLQTVVSYTEGGFRKGMHMSSPKVKFYAYLVEIEKIA